MSVDSSDFVNKVDTTQVSVDTLFVKPSFEETAIVLLDISGSVKGQYNGKESIYDREVKIIQSLRGKRFKLILWNDEFIKLPFEVNQKNFNQCFTVNKNQCGGATYPHVAFENIKDWIQDKYTKTIHFVTDGEFTYRTAAERKRLADSIFEIIKIMPDVQINIHTVENRSIDFNNLEKLDGIAGADVYKVISENKLTNYVSKFITFATNCDENGYTQINKVRAPSGYASYGDSYFPENKLDKFIDYLKEEIAVNKNNEDALLNTVQKLTVTINDLTKDKPKYTNQNYLLLFQRLFEDTALDQVIVMFMLQQSAANESAGKAELFTTYRAQLKELYKNAQKMLSQDVRCALNIYGKFMTLPYNGKIIVGESAHAIHQITMVNTSFQNGAIKVENRLVPIIPFTIIFSSQMSEQCLRQWIRAITSQMTNLNHMDDAIIYHVMNYNFIVAISELPENIKSNYRMLVTTMLRKKRLNTVNVAELDRLELGELPTQNNGDLKAFERNMSLLAKDLKLDIKPYSMWYLLCLAHGNKTLIQNQYRHCKENLVSDFGDMQHDTLLIHATNFDLIPKYKLMQFNDDSTNFEYTCPIKCTNTSMTGGFKIKPHKTFYSTHYCEPLYVISKEGFNELLTMSNYSVCMNCFTPITSNDFYAVPPKQESLNVKIFTEDENDYFKTTIQYNTTQNVYTQKSFNMNTNANKQTNQVSQIKNKILVFLRGTVGCGKTTYAEKFQKYVESKNTSTNRIMCLVEGTDKYCKNGTPMKRACTMVGNSIRSALSANVDTLVILIDTCGQHTNKNNVFGVNLNDFTVHIIYPNYNDNDKIGYLAWSLRNVLQRTKPSVMSNWNLNPETAGIETCVKVHREKASVIGYVDKSLFQISLPLIGPSDYNMSLSNCLTNLAIKANEYSATLKEPDFSFLSI